MIDYWEHVKAQDLKTTENSAEILDCVGVEAFKSLVQSFGGGFIYIPREDQVLKAVRDREIRRRFQEGQTYAQLCNMFRLCVATVRGIVNDKKE